MFCKIIVKREYCIQFIFDAFANIVNTRESIVRIYQINKIRNREDKSPENQYVYNLCNCNVIFPLVNSSNRTKWENN